MFAMRTRSYFEIEILNDGDDDRPYSIGYLKSGYMMPYSEWENLPDTASAAQKEPPVSYVSLPERAKKLKRVPQMYTVYLAEKTSEGKRLHEIKVLAENADDACAAAEKWFGNTTSKTVGRVSTNIKPEQLEQYKAHGQYVVHSTAIEICREG